MEASTKSVLAAHRAIEKPVTFLVDDDLASVFENEQGVLRLGKTRYKPEELWTIRAEGTLKLVVLSAARSAKELFRVLSLSERLVMPGGRPTPRFTGVDMLCCSRDKG